MVVYYLRMFDKRDLEFNIFSENISPKGSTLIDSNFIAILSNNFCPGLTTLKPKNRGKKSNFLLFWIAKHLANWKLG